MKYSVSLLTTKEDCQLLLDMAGKEKESLAYRKLGLVRQKDSVTATAQTIETELLSTNVELQALQSVYDSLPEGPTKLETFSNIKKGEYKKFLLEQRKGNYGVIALLQKETDIATIDSSITENDDFILQVTARMNEIG